LTHEYEGLDELKIQVPPVPVSNPIWIKIGVETAKVAGFQS
jgi:hypothetical protein